MKIDLKFKDDFYSVFVNELDEINLKGKVGIVSNSKVSGLHLEYLLKKLKCDEKYIITIPDGEEYKNLITVEQILEQLFVYKFDRQSTLIAFGGGVISDITGFVASIYQRGIKFINLPTTLLSQLDASVGGKCGINNKFGKNLIGSFYQPMAVYCETRFLQTLPHREFISGLSEAIKIAVVCDKELFENLEKNDLQQNLDNFIYKSISLKAQIVINDEKENGLRALLNYGHTFAHVIELNGDYKDYLHGEAVSIGINMANYLACEIGILSKELRDRIEKLLNKFGIPTKYKIKNIENFYESFFLDKKTKNKKINFILAKDIGKAEIYSDISKDIILKSLRDFL